MHPDKAILFHYYKMLACIILFLCQQVAYGQSHLLDAKMHHLRKGDQPEWTEFSKQSEGSRLLVTFNVKAGIEYSSIRLRQYDVNDVWNVMINDHILGSL